MGKKMLSAKQKKIAAMADPKDQINEADFKKLNKMKKAKSGKMIGGGHKNYKMSGKI